ncbi:MAG TPA: NotI family restriction endonuclease, partial [Armatimonadota bacterium]|nr:NotI family restriction endonuclease [Armatimonadota bacterium]
MALNPLAEVFGFRYDDMSEEAIRYRKHRLCPFHNKVPNCTKDKVRNPLGVCSINNNGFPVIICPIRFRENWTIINDAAEFFFPEDTTWTSLVAVRINDRHGKSAGNIDIVLVA